MSQSVTTAGIPKESNKVWAVRFLLFIAGLGGLLYGIDLGIIAAALPYLQSTAANAWKLSAQQISFIVAAVMLGSVLSSLFAGMLSDLFGRRPIMFLSGLLFVISIPIIALASGYAPLLLGRLIQGISGGLVGVVVPLYLAECLPAKSRGKGTAIFQLLLTMGFVVAALIGLYYARSVDHAEAAAKGTADAAQQILDAKDHAWRHIFWMSVTPGIIFSIGVLLIAESSRWLFRHGKKDAARASLLRTRSAAEADLELGEMEETARCALTKSQTDQAVYRDSLLGRKYVLPFLIACIILACNQATGINSVLSYIVNILNAAGLPGSIANCGDVSLKILNCVMTVVAVSLVDRKGRKFLLMLGSGGIIVCLAVTGILFLTAEKARTDYRAVFDKIAQKSTTPDDEYAIGNSYLDGTRGLKKDNVKAYAWLNAWVAKAPPSQKTAVVQAKLKTLQAEFSKDDLKTAEDIGKELDQALVVLFDESLLNRCVGKDIGSFPKSSDGKAMGQLSLVYSYGPFTNVQSRRCDAMDNQAIEIYRSDTVEPDNFVGKFFRTIHLNPFPNPAEGKNTPLEIRKAMISPVPNVLHGWLVSCGLFGFCAFFAVGPGVCVWLALSELMPTRIRSNGMSIALLINQFVSMSIAGVFLPVVGNYGYATMFFFWSGCTVIYFLTAAFLLPETKGKTLEEIEEYFSRRKKV
jgi:MFS family permease